MTRLGDIVDLDDDPIASIEVGGVAFDSRKARAGDAFFALAACLAASGSDPFHAAFIGNAVGAMKIRIVGQRHQITKPEILKYLSTLLK